jgi:hypothetical protein
MSDTQTKAVKSSFIAGTEGFESLAFKLVDVNELTL